MYINEGKEQMIFTVDSSSNLITLQDGSKWEAIGINTYKLPLWLVMNKAVVKKFGLNFQMTNTNRNETIDVRQAKKAKRNQNKEFSP